jgi:hypothetical protein
MRTVGKLLIWATLMEVPTNGTVEIRAKCQNDRYDVHLTCRDKAWFLVPRVAVNVYSNCMW